MKKLKTRKQKRKKETNKERKQARKQKRTKERKKECHDHAGPILLLHEVTGLPSLTLSPNLPLYSGGAA